MTDGTDGAVNPEEATEPIEESETLPEETTDPDPEENKDPEPESEPEGEQKPSRTPTPPGKPVRKASNADMLTSVTLLRQAEANVRRVVDIGAVKVAGNLLGTVRAARIRAEESLPLRKGD